MSLAYKTTSQFGFGNLDDGFQDRQIIVHSASDHGGIIGSPGIVLGTASGGGSDMLVSCKIYNNLYQISRKNKHKVKRLLECTVDKVMHYA